MTPPPIRYPLPTLIAAIALALLLWKGEEWSRPAREGLPVRWRRWTQGPPPPHSDRPRMVAGPIVRRVLLLRGDVPYSDRPGGREVGEVRPRQFADVYDVWPLAGEPTHYRIGNRQPLGWVAAADVLPWDTRLVLRLETDRVALSSEPGGPTTPVEGSPGVPLPVLAWRDEAIRVGVWDRSRPWSRIARSGWLRERDVPEGAWCVLLSQREVQVLLDRSGRGAPEGSVPPLTIPAVLGRLADRQPLSDEERGQAREALPRSVVHRPSGDASSRTEELLRIYEGWRPDAAWSGLSFRAVPLSALP